MNRGGNTLRRRAAPISFWTCRARVKAIAQDAHRSLTDTGALQLADISGLDPEDVLLPCDDDDWYHPEVLEHIHTAGVLRTGLLLWPDGVYGYRCNPRCRLSTGIRAASPCGWATSRDSSRAAERVVALQRIVARYLEREIDTSQSAFRWAMPHLAQVRDVFREAAGLK